jgi:Zn-dependent membrane protease YugP
MPKCRTLHGLSGFDVARQLMRTEQLDYLQVNQVPGELTDFYTRPTIDQSVANLDAAIGRRHGRGGPRTRPRRAGQAGLCAMRIRSGIVGVANLGSNLGYMLVFIGLMISAFSRSAFGFQMAVAGLVLFAAMVAFTLVTLPVEFNASSRASKC